MRILIPDELPYSTGIENVITSIVPEWLPEVESVTWLVSDLIRARDLSQKLENPPNLHFETFTSVTESSSTNTSKSSLLKWAKNFVKKIPALRKKAYTAYRTRIDGKIAQVAQKYRATHCWFHFVQGQSVPDLPIPVCGLVHDQNFRFYPENSPPGKPQQFRAALESWITQADMIAVLSQAGKEEIHSLGQTPVARIEIIPNAISNAIEQTSQAKREDRQFLYPAAALAHKNHILLFQTALLLAKQQLHCRFVICGKDTELLFGDTAAENPAIEAARSFFSLHRSILSPYFDCRGACSWEDLVKLYQTSIAVVLPSKYEGFGLPLVESLSRNTPVLCSDLIPFQEQVERYKAQDWVEFFDPDEPESLLKVLIQTLQRPSPFPALFPIENFNSWTWKDVANRYITLFKELSS